MKKKQEFFSWVNIIPWERTCRIMKVLLILMTATLVSFATGSYSQSKNLTFRLEKVNLIEIFEQIEKQSDMKVAYDISNINTDQRINISVDDASIENVLKKALENTDLSYRVINHYVIISSKDNDLSTNVQQQKSVSGKVIDLTGASLPGVSVVIKGTTIGVITDANGKYSLSKVSENGILQFSFVGMKTQEIKIGSQTEINVKLEEETVGIEEVVAIGYGTQSKRDVTSAINTIAPKEFNKGIVTGVNSLLAGKVAGLFISQPGSDPTKGATVQLRGSSTLAGGSQPLYVIDGFPGADISSVAVEDIKSITVAKDASSTAIYGTRGANGVIFITTKRGETGKTTLDYHTYYGVETISRRNQVATGDQVRAQLKLVNLPLAVTDNDGANTDWQKVISRTGLTKNNNIELGGGTEDTHYFASVTFNDRSGVVLKSHSNRFTGRFNLDQELFDKRLKLSVNVANNVINNSSVDNDVFYYALRFLPTSNVYNPDGSYKESPGRQNYYNPLGQINNADLIDKYNNMTANAMAVLKIIDGLNFTGTYGIQNSDHLFSQYRTNDNPVYSPVGGYAQRTAFKNGTSVYELYSDYSKTFGKHALKLLVGYSDEKDYFNDGVGAQSVGFLVNSSGYYGLLNGNIPVGFNPLGRFSDSGGYRVSPSNPAYQDARLISLYSRFNYNYGEKYILQGVIRRDGSSKFGANNKWAIFPAVSAAWVISQESFLKGNSKIENLKLRASYGISGNQGIAPYASLPRFGPSSNYYNNGTFNQGFYYTQNPNSDLKWEKTTTTDIGLDFGLWGNRLSGSVDYYYKLTTDLLNNYQVPVPPYAVNTILANGGSMYNKGIEIELSGVPITTGNFSWKTNFTFAANKNRITSLSNGVYSQSTVYTGGVGGQGLSAVKSQIQEVGQAIGTWYLPEYAGKDNSGASLYYKADGSVVRGNLITSSDNKILGSALPKFTYGWTNSLNYKNLGFSFTIRGVYGSKILNAVAVNLNRLNSLQSYNVSVAAIKEGNPDNPIYSSHDLENGSFLRLDNATISYKLPIQSRLIRSASIYMAGQNLFTITKFNGVDPEIDLNSQAPGINGLGSYLGTPATYFRTRTITIGLNIGF